MSCCSFLPLVKERCLSESDDVPPLLYGATNQATVDGGKVVFKCSFTGNYNRLKSILYTYWIIDLHSRKNPIKVDIGSEMNDYKMNVYPDCPTLDHRSLCCQFTSELHINVSTTLNKANVSCWVNIHNSSTSQSIFYSQAKLG